MTLSALSRDTSSLRAAISSFWLVLTRAFAFSFISTKARCLNPAVESGSTSHLLGHRSSDHGSFFTRRELSQAPHQTDPHARLYPEHQRQSRKPYPSRHPRMGQCSPLQNAAERLSHLATCIHQQNGRRPHASLNQRPSISRSRSNANNLLRHHSKAKQPPQHTPPQQSAPHVSHRLSAHKRAQSPQKTHHPTSLAQSATPPASNHPNTAQHSPQPSKFR